MTKPNIGGGKNPIWNEEFVYDISNEREMEVEVMDKEPVGKDRSMGRCKVSILEWIANGKFEGNLDVKDILGIQMGQVSIVSSFQRLNVSQGAPAPKSSPSRGIPSRTRPSFVPLYERSDDIEATKKTKMKAMEEFVKENNLKPESVKNAHKRFQTLDDDKSGLLDYTAFCEIFQCDPAPVGEAVFKLYDYDKTGQIDALEFLIAIANFTDMYNDDKLKFDYMIFDEEDNGVIMRAEFLKMLKANHMASDDAEVAEITDIIMSLYDKDSDGVITFDDLVLVLKKFPTAMFPVYSSAVSTCTSNDHGLEIEKDLLALYLELQLQCNEEEAEINGLSPMSPLHWAAADGNIAVVTALIERGADVNETNNDGYSFLHPAGNSPLHNAARNGQLLMVAILLAKGANVNQVNNDGETPLHLSVKDEKTANLLLEKGADVNLVDKQGMLPLHSAASFGSVAVTTALLDKGVNVNQIDSNGASSLHWAANGGQVPVISALLSNGGNVNQADNEGRTPLYWAANNGNGAVVAVLLSHGADVNQANDGGETPLHTTAYNGREAIVAVLLSNGSQVNHANKYGSTPLYIAAQYGKELVVDALLSKGAAVNQTNNIGKSPLDIAKENGHEAVVALLLEHGALSKEMKMQQQLRGILTITSIECHNLRPDWFRMGPFQVELGFKGNLGLDNSQYTDYRGGRKLLVWSEKMEFPIRFEDKYLTIYANAMNQLRHPLDRARHPKTEFGVQDIWIDELIEAGKVHLKLIHIKHAHSIHGSSKRTPRAVGEVSISCTFAKAMNAGGQKLSMGDAIDENIVLVTERALRTIPLMATPYIDKLQSTDLSFMPPFRLVAGLKSEERAALGSVRYLYSDTFYFLKQNMSFERWLRGKRQLPAEKKAHEELRWRVAYHNYEVSGHRSRHKFLFDLVKSKNLQRLQELGAGVIIISDPVTERKRRNNYGETPLAPEKFIVIRDMWGRTPLHIAVCTGHVEMVKWLVKTVKLNIDDHGAEPDDDTGLGTFLDRKTPLRLACERNDHQMISVLLELGANPLAKILRNRQLDEEEGQVDNDNVETALIGLTDVNQVDHRLHGNRKTYLHLAAGYLNPQPTNTVWQYALLEYNVSTPFKYFLLTHPTNPFKYFLLTHPTNAQYVFPLVSIRCR